MSKTNRKIEQFLIKASLIIVAACFSGYCDVKEAYDYIRQNQSIIMNAFSRCHPWSSPLYNIPCNFAEIDNIKTLMENNSVNDSIMELTVRKCLQNMAGISTLLSGRRTSIISDSISITFLSKLINGSSETDKNGCGYAASATHEIIRYVGYPSLHRYKNQINAAVMNSCVKHPSKRTVSILTGPEESKRLEFLKELSPYPEDVPFKARLGDTVAIERLRTEYQNAKFFEQRVSAINQIFISGRTELIKMVIADFNNPMYEVYTRGIALPCTSSSTQLYILRGLRRTHPEENLLNEDFDGMAINSKISSEKVKQYLESVTAWLEKKYLIKIANKQKAYILGRFCRTH